MPADDLIVSQLSSIIADLDKARELYGDPPDYDAKRIVTRARAAIRRFAPPGSPYEEEAEEAAGFGAEQWKASQLVAVVHALRDDYALGGLASVEELVQADLFDDFLDMADELLAKGFTGPAVVLAGTVLEQQLRNLAEKCGLAVTDEKERPKSVETLGIELRKAELISEVQRKSVIAWYAQRREAAHGRTDGLSPDDIERTIDGIRGFITRHPA
ncbi:MAG: hypothetical protein AB7V58_06250 [Solirubrobacterales bacterium]